MSASILVVGGGGYIGSHMVKMLCRSGYDVTVLDNFSTGYRDAIVGGRVVEGDLGDARLLDGLFSEGRFNAVMHFAGLIEVGESVAEPARYYDNNLVRTLTLIALMREYNINNFVFSSTAAVYGEPRVPDLSEDCLGRPINPYGRTKKFVEDVLADYDRAYGFRSVCLRYFNAAGADPEGELGERHDPETHLIPITLQVASGRRDKMMIYGDDYATDDGTCVRDFVHVHDLCKAHEFALKHLLSGGGSDRINLGSARGYSVREVIDTARRVTGRDIPVDVVDRRAGDPARLVADTRRAQEQLSWVPEYGLEDMIAHAWHREVRAFGPGVAAGRKAG